MLVDRESEGREFGKVRERRRPEFWHERELPD